MDGLEGKCPRGQARAPWEDDAHQPIMYKLADDRGTYLLHHIFGCWWIWHDSSSARWITDCEAMAIRAWDKYRCACAKCVSGA